MDRRGATLVLLATFGMALKGIWARLAYAEGMGVPAVLFYRSLLSVPLVVLTAAWFARRDGTTPLRPRDYVPGAVLGVMFSAGMVCDFRAIEALGASVSRVILFGFPAIVMLLTAVESRKMPSAQRVAGFSVAWLGLLGVASPGLVPNGDAPFGSTGLLWGAASLVSYAVYVWLSGRMTHKLGSIRLTSVSNLSTAAVVIAVVLFTEGGSMPRAAPAALGWVTLMVLFSTVAPYFLFMEGLRRLGPSDASLLAMSGPVVTVLSGWWVLDETLTALQLIGAGLTLVGVSAAQGLWASGAAGYHSLRQKRHRSGQICRKVALKS